MGTWSLHLTMGYGDSIVAYYEENKYLKAMNVHEICWSEDFI